MSRSAVNYAPTSSYAPQNKRELPRLIEAGMVFGRLTATDEYVIKRRSDGRNRCSQKFICDCGNFIFVAPFTVKSGNTSSCGCLHSEDVSARMTVHGKSKTSAYRVNLNRQRRGQKKSTQTAPVPLRILDEILEEHGNKCWVCDSILDAVAWDHVQPLSKGGTHTRDNLRPACKSCNSKKSNLWPFTDEMRQAIADEVRATRTSQEVIPDTDGLEVQDVCQ